MVPSEVETGTSGWTVATGSSRRLGQGQGVGAGGDQEGTQPKAVPTVSGRVGRRQQDYRARQGSVVCACVHTRMGRSGARVPLSDLFVQR